MKSRDDVIKILEGNNKSLKRDKIIMYCDLYMDYQESAKNIRDNGAICAHPKTGAPIDNPYLKVRQQMIASLVKIRVNSDGLW
jgi:phage terminase small subunit